MVKGKTVKKFPEDQNDNWVPHNKIEVYLWKACKIGAHEYYDLLFLHINDTDFRPECKTCGKELKFFSIKQGYSRHCTLPTNNLFCCKECYVKYQSEVKKRFGNFIEYTSIKNNETYLAKSKLEYYIFGKLDDSEKVKNWLYEPCSIPYRFEGKIHYYVPDLLIEYSDGTKSLAEIKYRKHLNTEQNYAKLNELKQYCKLNNFKFELIFENTTKF